MPLDVREIHGAADPRHLVKLAGVIPEIGVIDETPEVALEVAVIDGIEPDQRREQPLGGLYISMGYVPLVASLSHSANEGALAGVQLGVIVLKAREQMAVNVKGHLDGAVSKERLRLLGREPQRDNP